MKKFLTLLLTAALLLNLFVPALAEEITPRSSEHFYYYGTILFDNGGGILHVNFTVNATNFADELGVECFWVQQKTANGWVDVTDQQSGETDTDAFTYTFGRYFQAQVGATYRVIAIFTCTMNGSTELRQHTSNTITLK